MCICPRDGEGYVYVIGGIEDDPLHGVKKSIRTSLFILFILTLFYPTISNFECIL